MSELYKRLILPVLCLLLILSCPAAVSASPYDEALEILTDPIGQQIDISLRHEYSEDARISAMAAVYDYLSQGGIARLWGVSPETMRTLSIARLEALIAQGESEHLPDPMTATDLELHALIHYTDLQITDTAPMFELSWYDYGVDPHSYHYRYASEHLSGYMFAIACDGKYLALCKASYDLDGMFGVTVQSYPNVYYSLYNKAAEKTRAETFPILLTDPSVHDAVAFMVSNGDVYVKNAVSSTSKDEILAVDGTVFAVAAEKWNRDALSMLITPGGFIKPFELLEFNNIESYVRSQLRVAVKENLMRAACVLVSAAIVLVMTVLIVNKMRIRFLDENDPRRKWSYFLQMPVKWYKKLALRK